jgi:hypothetical protein
MRMKHTPLYAALAAAVLGTSMALGQATGAPASAPPAAAPGQDASQSDLRKEIDRLRQQVRALEADLQAALDRIEELERELAAKAAGHPPSGGTQAKPPVQRMPADPKLGPGGLLSMLQADYDSADAGFAGKETPSPDAADPQGRQAWEAHQRALDSWMKREQRKVTEVDWVGTIDPASVEQRGRDVAMTIVFTNGGRDFRAPVVVDQGLVDRLKLADGTITAAPIVVNAVVTPKLRLNPQRGDTGAFDNPPLVAPFVEFGYDLKVRVLLPADRAKPKGS